MDFRPLQHYRYFKSGCAHLFKQRNMQGTTCCYQDIYMCVSVLFITKLLKLVDEQWLRNVLNVGLCLKGMMEALCLCEMN